ncbi:hypothetical protein FRX31_020130 [Thalictrum thalictroides]|uniref:Uncharacterized protein n=1 Tax=Thalictrum thalictroides TaxID=46969 RepID=A0A7J6W1T2_THATH|nr:hypothetical protein FRX31_020130 [Thalictrum thalictroides]
MDIRLHVACGSLIKAIYNFYVIVYLVNWEVTRVKGIGWVWTGITWLGSITAFITKKYYGKEEREAQWASAQRTLHGFHQKVPRETQFQ